MYRREIEPVGRPHQTYELAADREARRGELKTLPPGHHGNHKFADLLGALVVNVCLAFAV
jgi:hypothetical protein